MVGPTWSKWCIVWEIVPQIKKKRKASPNGVYVLGFVVCLLLYAALLLQDVFACTMRVAHVYMCVGHVDKPTNRG